MGEYGYSEIFKSNGIIKAVMVYTNDLQHKITSQLSVIDDREVILFVILLCVKFNKLSE